MTLWKVTAGDVRLADELFTARTPSGVRPRDRDTGGAADSVNGSIPRSRLPRQRCLIRLRSGESAMPAVFGRTAVQPDTGHDLRPYRVIQGMDQLSHTRHPGDSRTGQRTLRLLPGRPPPADERSPHQRNRQEKRAIALLLRQESRYRQAACSLLNAEMTRCRCPEVIAVSAATTAWRGSPRAGPSPPGRPRPSALHLPRPTSASRESPGP